MSTRNKSPKATVSSPAIRVRSAARVAPMFVSYSSFEAPGEITTSSSGSPRDSAWRRSSVRRTPCMLIRSYSAVTVVRSAATRKRASLRISRKASALSLPPLHATSTSRGTSVTEPLRSPLERDRGEDVGMEEPGEQLHAVRDARPGTAEVRRGVDGVGASGANGPWRDGPERRAVVTRVGARRGEGEAARHHEQDVRVQAGQILPRHGERGPPRDPAQQVPAGQRDHLRYPVPRHKRRLEPLEREDAWRAPACDASAHGRDAPLDLAHTLLRAVRRAGGSPHEANRAEHAGDVVGVQREDLGARGEA